MYNPHIEFTGQPLLRFFNGLTEAEEFVSVLTQITSSPDGLFLPRWDHFRVGRDIDDVTPYLHIVYSPLWLGRQLKQGNVDDFEFAFFHVFENSPYPTHDHDVSEETMLNCVCSNLTYHHHQYCSISILDLFEKWKAQKQQQQLLNHIDSSFASQVWRKI